ncbi:MAG TPA: hypothetical protein VF941_15230 [Clostridia bacterium]
MKFNRDRVEKVYLNFIKWFGIIVFSIMYLLFISHLIIYKNVMVFAAGMLVTTGIAAIWMGYFKYLSKRN